MKQVKLLSLIGSLALLTACGNQGTPNPAAYNYGYGAQTGVYGNYGQPGWNTGFNTGFNNGFNNGWYSQPMQLAGSVYTRTYQVQAGQYVSTRFSWGAYIKCDRKLLDSYQYENGGMVSNVVVTFNGQAVPATTGGFQAPAAGTVTVTADLAPLSGNIRCGWSGNRPFEIKAYFIQQL